MVYSSSGCRRFGQIAKAARPRIEATLAKADSTGLVRSAPSGSRWLHVVVRPLSPAWQAFLRTRPLLRLAYIYQGSGARGRSLKCSEEDRHEK